MTLSSCEVPRSGSPRTTSHVWDVVHIVQHQGLASFIKNRVKTSGRLSSALLAVSLCPQESGTLTFQTSNTIDTVSLVWAAKACLLCSLFILVSSLQQVDVCSILCLTWEFAHTFAFAELASRAIAQSNVRFIQRTHEFI